MRFHAFYTSRDWVRELEHAPEPYNDFTDPALTALEIVMDKVLGNRKNPFSEPASAEAVLRLRLDFFCACTRDDLFANMVIGATEKFEHLSALRQSDELKVAFIPVLGFITGQTIAARAIANDPLLLAISPTFSEKNLDRLAEMRVDGGIMIFPELLLDLVSWPYWLFNSQPVKKPVMKSLEPLFKKTK